MAKTPDPHYMIHTVQDPNGGPVAAPCAISGCQYAAFEPEVSMDALLIQVEQLRADLAASESARQQAEQTHRETAAGLIAFRDLRDEALKILDTQSGSDLLDACRQVKQVAISEADNSEKAEAERDALQLRAEQAEARASASERFRREDAANHIDEQIAHVAERDALKAELATLRSKT